MAKNITIKEGAVAKNFTNVKKISTNQIGGGSIAWIPEDEAADYANLRNITIRENGTYTAEDEGCDGFEEVTVEIPADVREKVITVNGDYLAVDDNCLGYSRVTVNVAGGSTGDQHTVVFFAADRTTVLERQTVEDGGGAMYHGETPTSSGMRFCGWTPNPVHVTADMNCYPRFENLLPYDPHQIMDTWAEVAAKCNADPDAYNIGDYKLLELNAVADREDSEKNWHWHQFGTEYPNVLKMVLVGKRVDPLAGGNGYANTTWMSANVTKGSLAFSYNYDRNDNWAICPGREALNADLGAGLIPAELLPALKWVVKYSAGIESEVVVNNVPSVDALWIPSYREILGNKPHNTELPGTVMWSDMSTMGAPTYDVLFGGSDIAYTSAEFTAIMNNLRHIYDDPATQNYLVRDFADQYHYFAEQGGSGHFIADYGTGYIRFALGFCI